VDQRCGFGEVCIVTAKCAESRATPLHRANLANGHQQIIVIPDECRIDVAAEDRERLGRVVKFVHLDVPNPALARRYRLTASIVLAEVAREVGRNVRRDHVERPGLRYESGLDLLLELEGEEITLEDLTDY
jgi:hypothetical protein